MNINRTFLMTNISRKSIQTTLIHKNSWDIFKNVLRSLY